MNKPRIFDAQHYDLLNRPRAAVAQELLSEIRKPLKLETVIDVGCGLGHFSGLLKSYGFRVTAIDGRQGNLEEAQRRNPGVTFRQFDAEDPRIRLTGRLQREVECPGESAAFRTAGSGS